MNYREYKNNLKNLKGTFSVEGISISENSLKNLEKMFKGEEKYSEAIKRIKQKYTEN